MPRQLAGRTRPPTATGPGVPGSDQQLSRGIDTNPGSSQQPRRRRQGELAQLDLKGGAIYTPSRSLDGLK